MTDFFGNLGRLDSVITDEYSEKLPADDDDAFCKLNGPEGKDNYCNLAGTTVYFVAIKFQQTGGFVAILF